MPIRSSAGNVKVKVNLVAEVEEDRPLAEAETPFRVVLLGDFSGRGNRGIVETGNALRNRRVYPIDRDNFSELLSQLKVELHIPILGKDSPPVILHVTELDDFHPDRLFENLEVFDALRESRHSLRDPATFAALAKRSGTSSGPAEQPAPTKETELAGNLLDQILDATEDRSPTGIPQPSSDLDDFIKQTVRPLLVSKPHPMQAELVAKVDAVIGELMRRILHHPDFQAIEAAWRGLYFLVSQLETDENLKLFLLDISKAELAADLLPADDITYTGAYQLLLEQTVETSDEKFWALIAGNFTFDETRKDATLLSRLAKLARTAGAPFVAAADPHLLGCDSLAETPDPDDWRSTADNEIHEAWAALRKLPEASFLGLVLPRFLLRLPYGKETDPVERLDFEEMEATPRHEEYLWGNPSFACVYLLAQAFSQYGWNFRPGVIQEISGLPLHIYKEQGESRTKPCAETLLTQQAAEAILNRGLMPLLSFINQDIVRLARFQSLADPPSPLRGRWK
jgi:type VI secretion system protein ImpC